MRGIISLTPLSDSSDYMVQDEGFTFRICYNNGLRVGCGSSLCKKCMGNKVSLPLTELTHKVGEPGCLCLCRQKTPLADLNTLISVLAYRHGLCYRMGSTHQHLCSQQQLTYATTTSLT